MKSGTTYPKLALLQIVANNGFVTDGDWVESKDQDPEGTIRLTQLADVGDGWFRDRSDRWMNEEQVTRIGVTYLQEGDVLIARMPDPLGRACVCPRLPTPAVTVVDVCIVRTTRHNPKWVMYALNAPQSRKTIASLEAGSTRKRISKANLFDHPAADAPPSRTGSPCRRDRDPVHSPRRRGGHARTSAGQAQACPCERAEGRG